MFVTVLGISTPAMPVQPANAPCPMLFTVFVPIVWGIEIVAVPVGFGEIAGLLPSVLPFL